MKFQIMILFLFLCTYGKSQTMYEVKDNRYKYLSDSLININFDLSIPEWIRYSKTWETYTYRCIDFGSIFSIKPIKYVNVYYDFIDLCGQKYGYGTNGFRKSSGFQYTFDFEYNLICVRINL